MTRFYGIASAVLVMNVARGSGVHSVEGAAVVGGLEVVPIAA
jgi:hypothetical protein